jgi:hypothetical protein
LSHFHDKFDGLDLESTSRSSLVPILSASRGQTDRGAVLGTMSEFDTDRPGARLEEGHISGVQRGRRAMVTNLRRKQELMVQACPVLTLVGIGGGTCR